MKHWRMRCIRIDTIDPARRNNAKWRLMGLHVTHLYRRGVRAQDMLLIDVERIVHRTGGMIFWNIQRSEIVKVRLDFRSVRNGKSNRRE